MNATLRNFWLFICLIGAYQLQAAPTNDLQVTIELQDGSKVVGKSSGNEKLAFHSETLGEIKLPLEQIGSIECQIKTKSVKLTTASGDKLAVTFDTKEIHIETSFGKVKFAVEFIRRLTVSGAVSSGRMREGLVALWSGDGNAADSISGYDGQLMNGAGFAPGKVGQAFSLDGGGFVLIPAGPAVNVGAGNGFTISMWIKPGTVSREMLIAEFENELGTANGSDVGLDFAIQRVNGAGGWCLYANIPGTDNARPLVSQPNMIKPNVWQHIAITYDKTSGLAVLYLNDAVVARANIGNPFSQQNYSYLLLGAKTTYGSVADPRSPFSGGLDEISIYNRALSAAEIQAIGTEANNGEPLPPPTPSRYGNQFNSREQSFISE